MSELADHTVIRAAVAADLPGCAAIINDYVDATDWLPRTRSREALAALFAPDLLSRRTLLVVEAEGAVVGYMSLTPEGHVPALYLAERVRGRGLGRDLLDRAKVLHPGGLTLTVFEPNLEAARFYRREGFAAAPGGRVEVTEDGVPTILMRWPGAGA